MYTAAPERYERMQYRRSGRSGLQLPAVSLGLWHNFGHDRPYELGRAIARRAFDLGILHFDLANNYGPPYGSAEENFGRMLRDDLRALPRRAVVSTKAGYDMWPGPYGEWGSRKYLLASLDQSLARMQARLRRHLLLAPLRSRDAARGDDRRARHGRPAGQGALRRHLLLLPPRRRARRPRSCATLGTPIVIHQPSYSMLNRWIEPELLDALEDEGIGCIAFSPLAQGMLTDRYLDGDPGGLAREPRGHLALAGPAERADAREGAALNEIAAGRGQSLAQMAIAWVLRDPRVTSALIGASSVEQLEANVAALDRLDFDEDELAEIDRYATESDINLWARSSET